MKNITEITLKIVVDGEEKLATFLRPEKIKDILEDKEGKIIDWINDLIDAKLA